MQAAIYCRVSTLDQHPETQLLDLQQLASQRGFEVVKTYVDHGVSGTRVRRPGLDEMLADARRGRFQALLIWSCDRIARSTRHLLEVLDELSRLQIQFVSFREALDTSGALGRAVTVIIGAIAELERSLIIERVRAGMRRAKLEGRHIGRKPLDLDTAAIIGDRAKGLIFRRVAKAHQISTATVRRILSAQPSGIPENAAETRRSAHETQP
jgi:DNA invertase Pin-like site-specific DNA recombinase